MQNNDKLKVVFDTGIFISAFLTEGGLASALLRLCTSRLLLYTADYLITRDLDLLDLGEYGRIRILTPEDFTRILRERERQESNE